MSFTIKIYENNESYPTQYLLHMYPTQYLLHMYITTCDITYRFVSF